MTSHNLTNTEIDEVARITSRIHTDIQTGLIQNFEKFEVEVNHTTSEFRYMFDRGVPINTTPVTIFTLTILNGTTMTGPLKITLPNPTTSPGKMILFGIARNS